VIADKVDRIPTAELSELLENNLERERKHLDDLVRSKSSWLHRYKQRSAVRRAKWLVLWSEKRAEGSGHFLWRQGILGYGASMFVAMQILLPISKGHPPLTLADLVVNIVIGLPIWFAVGLGWGLWTWEATERKYRKALAALAPSRRDALS